MLIATLPGGGKLEVSFVDEVAASLLVFGGYETREIECLRAIASPGTTAIDVGANVGAFAIPLAGAVGNRGTVMAIEPLPANIERLNQNLALNHLHNVKVFPVAVGEGEGETVLEVAEDPSFSSTVKLVGHRVRVKSMIVPRTSLDRIWKSAGRPRVTAMKIDVEGAELAVLRGAEEVLLASKPALLIEANTRQHLKRLSEWLSARGYRRIHPRGFLRQNHLLIGRASADDGRDG